MTPNKSKLASVLGPPPWSTETLSSFRGPLHVSRAEDLSELASVPNLEELTLEGCRLDALSQVLPFKELRILRIRGCSIGDLANVAELRSLAVLEVRGALIEDLAPISELPNLAWVSLHGLPLSTESMREVLPRLFTTPRKGTGRVVSGSLQDDWYWNMNLTLRASGLEWAALPGANDRTFAVRIGRLEDGPAVVEATKSLVDRATWTPGVGNDTLSDWLIANGGSVSDFPAEPPSAFQSGDAEAARARVTASALPPEDKAALMAFLARFPEQRAWWQSGEAVDQAATTYNAGAPYPGGWKEYRTTLAMIVPGFSTTVRFRSYEEALPGVRRSPGEMLFFLSPHGGVGSAERRRFHGERLVPVGADQDGGVALVYDADQPGDRTIYVVSQDEPSFRAAMSPAFSSYATMLAHVQVVDLYGSVQVAAKEPAA